MCCDEGINDSAFVPVKCVMSAEDGISKEVCGRTGSGQNASTISRRWASRSRR